jgi:GH35 family endo-1,4-beta-xylanase
MYLQSASPCPSRARSRRLRTACLLAVCAGAPFSPARAADPAPYDAFYRAAVAPLPGKPTPLFEVADLSRLPRHGTREDAAVSVVDAPGQPFAQALRVEVKRRTDPAWKVQVTTPTSLAPVKKGDALFIAFSARCTASVAETGGGALFATLQQTQTYDSLASLNAAPGKQWTRLYLRTLADRDYPAQNIELVFHLGKVEQTLEFGGFVAVNLGPKVDLRQLPLTRVSYEGQSADAPWRKQALSRIENIRTGDLAVRIETADGTPVTNVMVRARMTRHAYQFGTFIEDTVLRETDDGKKYRETLMRLFNRATCPLYWSDWGWEHPENRLTYIAIAQWAKLNGFYTRGHCLIWPGWRWLPKELEALKDKPDALRKAIDDHFTEVVSVMKAVRFDTYDVMNEPRVNHALMDILGPQEPARWFKLTHEIDPHPALGINEFAIVAGGGDTREELDLYMRQIRDLQDSHAPLGVIGVQCHMGENLTPPHKVIEILDRLATLKLPIHATEFDISTDDEQTQGDYMRDFLIAFFSHPATESLTQWGFWEGRHWIPRAALFDKKWRVKPNGQAYIDLVKGAWWTDETRATDHLGYSRIRGFQGDYEVTATLPGGRVLTRTARIERTGAVLTLQVGKPD